jgi:two-component system, NarL family, response regulator
MGITPDELQSLRRAFRLSPRETELLGLMLDGIGANSGLAERMGVTVGTVKGLVHSLLVKIGTSEKLEAAIIALRHLGRL